MCRRVHVRLSEYSVIQKYLRETAFGVHGANSCTLHTIHVNQKYAPQVTGHRRRNNDSRSQEFLHECATERSDS